MKVLIQRVKHAKVSVNEKIIGSINNGLLLFLGVGQKDTERDSAYLVEKIANLRIFEDAAGKMNLSLLDKRGEALIISQFTLYADCKRGRRPSFEAAAAPALALELYKKFVQKFRETGLKIEEGEFGAMMEVALVNDGPVTLMLESE